MASRWVNEKVHKPERDGYYIVQTVFGDVRPMSYTVKHGWNTVYAYDGELIGEEGFNDDGYIVRWHDYPMPPSVPKAVYEAYGK